MKRTVCIVSFVKRTLDIDAPFFFIQAKGLQRSFSAEAFSFVDMFITAIVSCTRVSFRVFVCSPPLDEMISYLRHEIVLCIILPSVSSTACEVKFSDGMRLMKCLCLRFSYKQS